MRPEPNFGLAHRTVLGRRPEFVKWTPSKPLPWWLGTWRDDRRFTAEQERVLIAGGRDPVTAPAIVVLREASHDEDHTLLGDWRAVFQFEAPLIARRADDKVTIIAPDGSTRHIRSDGWATKPSRWPYQGHSY